MVPSNGQCTFAVTRTRSPTRSAFGKTFDAFLIEIRDGGRAVVRRCEFHETATIQAFIAAFDLIEPLKAALVDLPEFALDRQAVYPSDKTGIFAEIVKPIDRSRASQRDKRLFG
jgi:hypothetical protein